MAEDPVGRKSRCAKEFCKLVECTRAGFEPRPEVGRLLNFRTNLQRTFENCGEATCRERLRSGAGTAHRTGEAFWRAEIFALLYLGSYLTLNMYRQAVSVAYRLMDGFA